MNIETNASSLEKELSYLKKTYQSYELEINNLYNLIRESNLFWQDNVSKRFYSDVEIKKNEIKYSLEIFKEKIETIQYIYDKYIEVGNLIKCNLNAKEKIINKLNNILNSFEEIISKYRNLSLGFCSYERTKLNKEKKQFIDTYNKMMDIKEKVIKCYNKIENIEQDVLKKISSIENFKIEEFNYEQYL